MESRALVIFSGGQDSTTCLFWTKQRFKSVEAITFDYGQRHAVELQCAKKICADAGIPQIVVPVDALGKIGANALVDHTVSIKTEGGFQNLPSTFVPGRNALFLTLAAAYALPRGIRDLVLGVCETDYSGYPDCREEFIQSMRKSLSLAMDSELHFHTPLMRLTKAETFALAKDLDCMDTVIRDTNTCYEGTRGDLHEWGYGCGHCPACLLRKAGYRKFCDSNASEVRI